MTRYALDPDLSLAAAQRTAALAETERALAALRRGDARGVHEMRKSCKRLRAWTRLLRDVDETAAARAGQIDRLLRSAAHTLGAAREAVVAAETFAALPRPASISSRAWTQLRRRLRDEARRRGSPSPVLVARAARALEAAQRQIGRLRLQDLPARELKKGLRHSRRRADKRFRAAGEGDAGLLHEWRKATKRLAYQQDLLQARLGRQPPAPRKLDELNELLGQHHDLHLLEQRLLQEKLQDSDVPTLLRRQARALEKRIRKRGAKLFG